MRFIAALFSVSSLLGTPAFAQRHNRPAPPIPPDTIVQWTVFLTAGIIPRYVHCPVASDSSRRTMPRRERSQGRQA